MAFTLNNLLSPSPPNLPKPSKNSPKTSQFIKALQTQQNSKFVITGGSKLSGHVAISGSKNAVLAILAATLCCSGTCKLKNMPSLSDTSTMLSILGSLGAEIEVLGDEVMVNTDGVRSVEPCCDEMGKIRGGFFVVGPLLARFGEAVVALPGGCDIGARPVDLYVRGLRELGAIVELRDFKVHAHAAHGKGLVGGRFRLDYPSVGATETLMMAASMADGVTVLSNVAQEPEVVDLAHFLRESGACVEGAGTNELFIKGRKQLHGHEYAVIPDRIEAGTFLLAAAITRSCISTSPVIPFHLSCLIDKLLTAGCRIKQHKQDILEISAIPAKINDDLCSFDVKTSPYPGCPTDLQPQTMALLTTCNGLSVIEESVFENRMGHELQKFGPRIHLCGSTALVFGRNKGCKPLTVLGDNGKPENALYGSRVAASNLRGGASLVLAGLAAEGTTEVNGIVHVDQGYQNFNMKLQLLGANVKRVIY